MITNVQSIEQALDLASQLIIAEEDQVMDDVFLILIDDSVDWIEC